MSLYNMLFGKNTDRALVLALIGLKECDVERFRDCGIDYESKQVWVYTRTGGGNRDDYPNELLTSNPYYFSDKDDDFDSTYATYYFKFPEEIAQDIEALRDTAEHGISGALITHIQTTLSRTPTENDKWSWMYQEQSKVASELKYSGGVAEFNGHTFVPLNDRAMEAILRVAEKHDGEFHPYMIGVYGLTVQTDVPTWSFSKEMSRVKIDTDWKLDMTAWNRYKDIFGEKYPKSIAHLDERYRTRKDYTVSE